MTRPHSAQGHAAAGRYYGQRGLRPFASERPPSNMDRLARYYSHPAAIERRPRFQLAAPSHSPAILPCRGDVSGTYPGYEGTDDFPDVTDPRAAC